MRNLLVFQNKKLTKSVFIKDDKYNLLQADPEKQTYTLYLNSPLKFKDTISSVGEVQWSDFSITDFDLEVEFSVKSKIEVNSLYEVKKDVSMIKRRMAFLTNLVSL